MNVETIYKQREFWEFVSWIAQPATDREPRTQKELAEKLKVDEHTLVDWKQIDGFWEEVKKIRLLWVKDKVSSVLLGLYGKALKGDPQAVKLFLQYAGEFIEEVKVIEEKEYSPETVRKVMETLKNEGFTIATGNNNGQGEKKNSSKE